MTVVVIGNGMAGSRFAVELRNRDPHRHVVLFGDEPVPAYNRVLLSDVLAGKVNPDDLALPEPYGPVDRRIGVSVVAIDQVDRVVVASDGSRTHYSSLVLATGSSPNIPQIPGLLTPDGRLRDGITAFRTLHDCRRILEQAESARDVVVLGGGLLGLEAARGLAHRGYVGRLDEQVGCGRSSPPMSRVVRIVHAGERLMDKQLDAGAAHLLQEILEGFGIKVRLGSSIAAIRNSGQNAAEDRPVRAGNRRVVLEDGTSLPADLVVLACGVRPEVSLAVEAGLEVGRGVVVDSAMRTSDPAIFAIGDCAEHNGSVHGLVAPAWEQARVVADVICGIPSEYGGSRLVTRLKATDVDLASMGDPNAAGDSEVVTFADPARLTYQKLVLREGRLIGAILLGDNPTVGAVTQAFDRGDLLPADPRSLLFGGSGSSADNGSSSVDSLAPQSVICRCNGVSAGGIVRAWLSGARSVEQVAAKTRASTGCGSCKSALAEVLDGLEACTPSDDIESTATMALEPEGVAYARTPAGSGSVAPEPEGVCA